MPWPCFHYPFLVNEFCTGTITVSLNYTLKISHIKSSLHSRTRATNSCLHSLPYKTELSTGRLRVLDSRHLSYDWLRLTSRSKSKSKSYCDWRSVGQSVSKSWCRPDIYYCLTVTVLFLWGALSDERTGLSFTIAAGSRQRSNFRVRVP
jgi:hypothetical protein